uniref:SoHo domain-containing protein n=1 Tax=Malurus cyaneus samueli TaxID=2593467 RepID=A0A8C5TSM0_9PASS
MAGRLPHPDPGPALGTESVPRLQPPPQVSPQHTVTRVSGAGGCHTPGHSGGFTLHPFATPPCQPLPVPQVPVIRHRGSNTLNFHFHDTESPGAAESGKGAPKNSGKALNIPGDTPGGSPEAAPTCPRPPGWSATWTKDSKRRERRWVKYDGIGPVDETGMPLASRSSVDSPRDWYRSMFRQIHRKLHRRERNRSGVVRGGMAGHPLTSSILNASGPTQPRPARAVLLEQELEQLSEELDKDMRTWGDAPDTAPGTPPALRPRPRRHGQMWAGQMWAQCVCKRDARWMPCYVVHIWNSA